MRYVGDLVEHWAWVLEGPENQGHAEGRALFRAITEEILERLQPSQRSSLRRHWRRRQDNYVVHASAPENPQRLLLISRRAKLEQVSKRFPQLPQPATPP